MNNGKHHFLDLFFYPKSVAVVGPTHGQKEVFWEGQMI